jgi:hypothetical protein
VPRPNDYERFGQTLSRVALASGATKAAAVLSELLERGRFPECTLDEPLRRRLVDAGYAVQVGSGRLAPSDDFAAVLGTWRKVLCGEPADLGACGSETLDAFAARLVAEVAGLGSADEARRELRRQGVAAFGMLELAA